LDRRVEPKQVAAIENWKRSGSIDTDPIDLDAGVVDADDKDAFIVAAKTRQWEREKSVRTLA
jgi:hypothetical protein